MNMKWALTAIAVAASASMAFGYTGATVSVFEADVTTSNLSVFPVPAAAGMSGAQLLYDNSALLSFSLGYVNATDRNWLTMPLSSAGLTVNNVSVTGPQGGPSTVTGVNNSNGILDGQYYTNIQETATDPRFPANIPRPGRDCDVAFSAFQFEFTQAVQQFGVFIARNSNAWSYITDWNPPGVRNGQWYGDAGQPYPDDNNIIFANKVFVAVLGASDTFATAQYANFNLNGRAPFIKVTWNGTDLIDSVCVFQDAGWQGAPTFGFFDVYAIAPAPQTYHMCFGDYTQLDGTPHTVDDNDLLAFGGMFGSSCGDGVYWLGADFDLDGDVDDSDLLGFGGAFGTEAVCVDLTPTDLAGVPSSCWASVP